MTPPSANVAQPGQRRVGPFEVGPLAFGCWRLTTSSTDEAGALVNRALDLGCTLVDTADVYGLDWGGDGFGACEERLGQVLLQQPSLRDRMVLATKGGIVPGVPYDSSASGITQACEASLRRLHVDHVDLYQIHRPDMFTHPAELAEALMALRGRGLVGEFGVSNHTPAQTAALQAHLAVPLVATQFEYSAMHLAPLRDGTFDHAITVDMSVLAWSPLGGGRLATGEGCPESLLQELDRLAALHDTDRVGIAVAFVLAHPTRPVAIVGTQRVERLEAAVHAAHVTLHHSDLYAIVTASDGRPLP
jgi:predicted oxidoreductase